MQNLHQKSPQKLWKKEIRGNRVYENLTNPLRNFLEKEIQQLNFTPYDDRPHEQVNFSYGDPTIHKQFRTTPENLQAIYRQVGKIDGYTNMQGLAEARQSICAKFNTKNYKLDKDDIFLCSGGMMAIFMVVMLLAEEDDNFLVPSPGFPIVLSYGKSVKAKPRYYNLQPNENWNANIKQMEELIDQRTRFIYINDPSNPLGSCWSADHKKAIIDLARRHDIPILADEIYEGMTYDKSVDTFADYSTEDVTIIKCSGLTKGWLGPGWRFGWIIVYASEAKKQIYNKSLRGIFNILLMPNTVMQAAIPQIIKNPTNSLNMERCLGLMWANQKQIQKQLAGEVYCRLIQSSGTLYATIVLDLSQFRGFLSDSDFATQFYLEENVIVFPGKVFSDINRAQFIRLVISTPLETIKTFIHRFKRFCNKHLQRK